MTLNLKEHCIALDGTKTPQGMPIKGNLAKGMKEAWGCVQETRLKSDFGHRT